MIYHNLPQVQDTVQAKLDEIKEYLSSQLLGGQGGDESQLTYILDSLLTIESGINGIEESDLYAAKFINTYIYDAVKSEKTITPDDAILYIVALQKAGLDFHFDDDAMDCLGDTYLSVDEICAIQFSVNKIMAVDWSDSIFDDAFDVLISAHNHSTTDIEGCLHEDLLAWQAENNLPNQCAQEQLDSLDLSDPRRAYLEEFIVKWDKVWAKQKVITDIRRSN